MDGKEYISVILPLKLEWEPCYRTSVGVCQGDRVRVMFANKEYVGVVDKVGITPEVELEKIREIISVETDLSSVLPEEIALWKQVAGYYLCSVGEVYKAAYPSIKTNMEQARADSRRKVCERREKAVEMVRKKIDRLQARLEKKLEDAESVRTGTKARTRLEEEIERLGKEIQTGQSALESAICNLNAAKAGMMIPPFSGSEDNITLSPAQIKAISEIEESFRRGRPALLHGVTGSGKTEIYIRLAMEALKKGRNVLYLVPEIALSRQLEERLHEHFQENLLIFHSGESVASRRNSAEMIRNSGSGNYIALSTRSGLFLPHHDLGLIIVDEEHDSSYKQDSPAPRYNGRDTALLMSRIHQGCNIILGSATPSLEAVYNASTGKYSLVRLTEKYHGEGDIEVEIVDTKAERRKRGMAGSFSRKLIDRIRTTLQEGGQILILRSRRAWSTSLQCEDCGEIARCPHCNVSLSLHRDKDTMICHYCGYSAAYTGHCVKCSGPLNGIGAGTQKIEEEAGRLFPDAVVARLDSDSSQEQKKIISDFAKGEINILIGTQIIGKGFDFSNIGLVAVIAADAMLSIQDFRADEKALHLLEQFRGRCGRRGKKGMFMIQTSQPEHPVYESLKNMAGEDFTKSLLAERQDFGFPPYSRIIEITIRDRFEDRAGRMALWLAERFAGFNITGPYKPSVDRIADQHIQKIRICLPKDRTLMEKKRRIREIISGFEKSKKYDDHITVDVDPA